MYIVLKRETLHITIHLNLEIEDLVNSHDTSYVERNADELYIPHNVENCLHSISWIYRLLCILSNTVYDITRNK